MTMETVTMSDVQLRTARGVRGDAGSPLTRMAAASTRAAGVYAAGERPVATLRADDDSAGDGDGDGLGTLVGYPIVFDQWTEISSWWEGDFLERIDPGALDTTLARRGDRVKVQFNHGMDFSIGDKPLGKPRVQQPDGFGMWAETPLSDTSYNRDLAALIRDGAIDGQSFRFSVVDEQWHSYGDGDEPPDYNPKGLDERTITRLDLYEHGPVTFPAYEATTLGIRSAEGFAAWRAGDDDARAAIISAVAVRHGLRDIDPHDVLHQMRNGSRVVAAGPPGVTSDADDMIDSSRADDPRPPGRTSHAARLELLAQRKAQVAALTRGARKL